MKAARNWARQTRAQVRSLLEQPRMGRKVPEFDRDDLRELIYERNYRIIYRLLSDEIEIVSIFHAAQTLPGDL